MRKVWKWIIGIVVALVILAIVAGVAMMFLRPHLMGGSAWYGPGARVRGPWMMMPFGHGGYMMRGFGWMMPFGGLFGGFITLGILTLAVLGIVWLVRRVAAPQTSPAAQQTPAPVQATCKRCGKPVEAGWVACPHCGKKL